ncbi:MAG: sugar phosphate nucleotidyltransferase, partial [Nitrospinota bacterium]|nr:sugar phosphate nucleotidyltransferase [Nitrospinota bacterium]
IIHSPGRPVIGQLMEAFEKKQAPVIAVEKVPMENVSSYGVIDPSGELEGALHQIRSMVEKPPVDKAPSNLAIIGRYILTPEIFDFIDTTAPDTRGEIQLTTALNSQLEKSPAYALEFSGTRYDAGDKLGFLIATVEYALRSESLRDQFREYLKKIKL